MLLVKRSSFYSKCMFFYRWLMILYLIFFYQRNSDAKWSESLDIAKELIINFVTLIVTGELTHKLYVFFTYFLLLIFSRFQIFSFWEFLSYRNYNATACLMNISFFLLTTNLLLKLLLRRYNIYLRNFF